MTSTGKLGCVVTNYDCAVLHGVVLRECTSLNQHRYWEVFLGVGAHDMTVSTENAAPPKSTKSTNSNSSR